MSYIMQINAPAEKLLVSSRPQPALACPDSSWSKRHLVKTQSGHNTESEGRRGEGREGGWEGEGGRERQGVKEGGRDGGRVSARGRFRLDWLSPLPVFCCRTPASRGRRRRRTWLTAFEQQADGERGKACPAPARHRHGMASLPLGVTGPSISIGPQILSDSWLRSSATRKLLRTPPASGRSRPVRAGLKAVCAGGHRRGAGPEPTAGLAGWLLSARRSSRPSLAGRLCESYPSRTHRDSRGLDHVTGCMTISWMTRTLPSLCVELPARIAES